MTGVTGVGTFGDLGVKPQGPCRGAAIPAQAHTLAPRSGAKPLLPPPMRRARPRWRRSVPVPPPPLRSSTTKRPPRRERAPSRRARRRAPYPPSAETGVAALCAPPGARRRRRRPWQPPSHRHWQPQSHRHPHHGGDGVEGRQGARRRRDGRKRRVPVKRGQRAIQAGRRPAARAYLTAHGAAAAATRRQQAAPVGVARHRHELCVEETAANLGRRRDQRGRRRRGRYSVIL